MTRRAPESSDGSRRRQLPGAEEGTSVDDVPASRRGSTLVAAGIFLSRVSGLVRERVLGHFLGTSAAADAFTAAFRIPNLLQHLLGEGVLSASFIPVYSRLLADGRKAEAGMVAGAIAGLLAALSGALALVGIVLAEPLTRVVAAGFGSRPETFELTVSLVRIMFPGVGFLVLSAWCLGVLNSHGRFFLSYVAPVILNVAQIAVLVGVGSTVLAAEFASAVPDAAAQASLATWLAVGTLVGGALQFLVQLPGVRAVERDLRLSVRTDLPGVRATGRAFTPAVLGRGVVQLSSYVQVFLASFLAVGALATMRYAQILYLLPISLFGMSVAAAELPALARAGTADVAATVTRLERGLARIATFVVPTAAAYLVVGDLLIGALFRTGQFGRLEAVAVWIVLCGFTLGLFASTASRLLQSALYAAGDTRTPARVAVLRVSLSVALGVVLMIQFDRVAVAPDGLVTVGELPAFGLLDQSAGGPEVIRLGSVGLAVAGAVAAWVEQALLSRAVRARFGRTRLGGGQLWAIVAAAAVAAAVALAARPLIDDLAPLLAGVLAAVVVAAVYGAAASRLGVPDIRAITGRLLRR